MCGSLVHPNAPRTPTMYRRGACPPCTYICLSRVSVDVRRWRAPAWCDVEATIDTAAKCAEELKTRSKRDNKQLPFPDPTQWVLGCTFVAETTNISLFYTHYRTWLPTGHTPLPDQSTQKIPQRGIGLRSLRTVCAMPAEHAH